MSETKVTYDFTRRIEPIELGAPVVEFAKAIEEVQRRIHESMALPARWLQRGPYR